MHSRYQRRLSDLGVAGRAVLLHVTARRFFCGNSGCSRKTIAETFPGLADRYRRTTHVLNEALRRIGQHWADGPARGWPVG